MSSHIDTIHKNKINSYSNYLAEKAIVGCYTLIKCFAFMHLSLKVFDLVYLSHGIIFWSVVSN